MENATVKLSCYKMGQVSPKISYHGVHRGPTALGAESHMVSGAHNRTWIASPTALAMQTCKSA